MNADKARIRELEEILLFVAGGLRSKAAVYANQRNINPAAAGDPVQILRAAADEVQIAVGCSMAKDYASAQNQLRVTALELVIGDQLRQFGPLDSGGPAALVTIGIEQNISQLRHPVQGVVAERPNGMSLSIIIDPAEGAERHEAPEITH